MSYLYLNQPWTRSKYAIDCLLLIQDGCPVIFNKSSLKYYIKNHAFRSNFEAYKTWKFFGFFMVCAFVWKEVTSLKWNVRIMFPWGPCFCWPCWWSHGCDPRGAPPPRSRCSCPRCTTTNRTSPEEIGDLRCEQVIIVTILKDYDVWNFYFEES